MCPNYKRLSKDSDPACLHIFCLLCIHCSLHLFSFSPLSILNLTIMYACIQSHTLVLVQCMYPILLHSYTFNIISSVFTMTASSCKVNCPPPPPPKKKIIKSYFPVISSDTMKTHIHHFLIDIFSVDNTQPSGLRE